MLELNSSKFNCMGYLQSKLSVSFHAIFTNVHLSTCDKRARKAMNSSHGKLISGSADN